MNPLHHGVDQRHPGGRWTTGCQLPLQASDGRMLGAASSAGFKVCLTLECSLAVE